MTFYLLTHAALWAIALAYWIHLVPRPDPHGSGAKIGVGIAAVMLVWSVLLLLRD